MSRKRWFLVALFTLLFLFLSACGKEAAPTPALSNAEVAVPTKAPALATIPPVMTPTIVIPEVTKTEPPAETATSVPTEVPS
ncbi:MAG: hypothetical protein IAF02_04325, partial [Anaerolineae bacterium]|nr:hypothetical protein [Anaerolineae bacterium]